MKNCKYGKIERDKERVKIRKQIFWEPNPQKPGGSGIGAWSCAESNRLDAYKTGEKISPPKKALDWTQRDSSYL